MAILFFFISFTRINYIGVLIYINIRDHEYRDDTEKNVNVTFRQILILTVEIQEIFS